MIETRWRRLHSLENVGTSDVDNIKANVIKLAGDVLLGRQKGEED